MKDLTLIILMAITALMFWLMCQEHGSTEEPPIDPEGPTLVDLP